MVEKKKSKKKKKKERRYSNSDRQEYSRCIYIRACHCFPDFPIKCPAWPAPSCPPANVPRFILFPFLLLSLSLSPFLPLSPSPSLSPPPDTAVNGRARDSGNLKTGRNFSRERWRMEKEGEDGAGRGEERGRERRTERVTRRRQRDTWWWWWV